MKVRKNPPSKVIEASEHSLSSVSLFASLQKHVVKINKLLHTRPDLTSLIGMKRIPSTLNTTSVKLLRKPQLKLSDLVLD